MKLAHKIGWYGTECLLGIELPMVGEDFRVLVIYRMKGEIKILYRNSFSAVNHLFNWLEHIPNVPIVVYFPLKEQVEKIVSSQEKDVIFAVLGVSVASRKEFLVQNIPLIDGMKRVVLARKGLVNRALGMLKSYKDRVIYVNLSTSLISYLVSFLPAYSSHACYAWNENENTFFWKNGPLSEYQGVTLNLEPESLASSMNCQVKELGLYASLRHYWMSEGKDIGQMDEIFVHQKKVKLHQKLVRYGVYAASAACLIWLLSFSAQSYYAYRIQGLRHDLVVGSSVMEELKVVEANLLQKQNFLDRAKKETLVSSKIGLYVDAISNLVPAPIVLNGIIIQPSEDEIKKYLSLHAEVKPDILVMGHAPNVRTISGFTQNLKDLPFINHSEIYYSEYDYQNEQHNFAIILNKQKESTE